MRGVVNVVYGSGGRDEHELCDPTGVEVRTPQEGRSRGVLAERDFFLHGGGKRERKRLARSRARRGERRECLEQRTAVINQTQLAGADHGDEPSLLADAGWRIGGREERRGPTTGTPCLGGQGGGVSEVHPQPRGDRRIPQSLLETTKGGSLRAAAVLSTDSPPKPLHMGSTEAISRCAVGRRGAWRTLEVVCAGKGALELLPLLAVFPLALEQLLWFV